jgi:hypothetical protein
MTADMRLDSQSSSGLGLIRAWRLCTTAACKQYAYKLTQRADATPTFPWASVYFMRPTRARVPSGGGLPLPLPLPLPMDCRCFLEDTCRSSVDGAWPLLPGSEPGWDKRLALPLPLLAGNLAAGPHGVKLAWREAGLPPLPPAFKE